MLLAASGPSGSAVSGSTVAAAGDARGGQQDAAAADLVERLHLGQLDTVLSSFLTTHRYDGGPVPSTLAQLLLDPPKGKLHLTFQHGGMRFLAALESWVTDDGVQLNLRLPTAGYEFSACAGCPFVAHSHRCDYVVVQGAGAAFPTVSAGLPGACGDVLYSCQGRCVSVLVYPREPAMASLELTFEPMYTHRQGQPHTTTF